MPSRPRVNIIGAGPGGLATALLLARTGADVHIFERQTRVGGRTSALEAQGFRFDLGPTFFMYPRILEEIYQAAGRTLREEVDLIRLDPHYRLVFGRGGQMDVTPDVPRMQSEIAQLCPADAPQLPAFLAENRRKLEAFRPILEKSFEGWRSFFDPAMLSAVPLLRPHLSVEQDLRRFFTDERVRLAFCFQSKYLGMSPFRCPSLFSILSFLEYEYGVWHPRGGCAAVMESMAGVAQDLGVTLHLDTEVAEISFTGRRATGLRTTSGAVHPATATVMNADFAHGIQRLVPDHLRRRWSDRAITEKKFSCSTFMLYLGVEGSFPDLPHHQIFITDEYEKNLHQISESMELPEAPSFYVQNACVTDPTLAPPGHSTLYVLIPVPHETPGIDWTAEAARYRALALAALPKLGFPADIESRIRFEKCLTPSDWQSDLAIHLGATFNLSHNLGQLLHLRPHNRFEDVDGLYLVGGGTHPGSGLPVIFEGARITADLVREDCCGLK
jgi:phytoene desaturase